MDLLGFVLPQWTVQSRACNLVLEGGRHMLRQTGRLQKSSYKLRCPFRILSGFGSISTDRLRSQLVTTEYWLRTPPPVLKQTAGSRGGKLAAVPQLYKKTFAASQIRRSEPSPRTRFAFQDLHMRTVICEVTLRCGGSERRRNASPPSARCHRLASKSEEDSQSEQACDCSSRPPLKQTAQSGRSNAKTHASRQGFAEGEAFAFRRVA